MTSFLPAPPLITSDWLNAPPNFGLAALRGRVVVMEAFQMLCPGCVRHGLPLAQQVVQSFDPNEVAVIGLHTVFEHHAAQGTRVALEAFAHEYRLTFPIGMDAPDPAGPIPQTMQAYAMQGTPTLVLIDRLGKLRMQHFGQMEEMKLGAIIMSLVLEGITSPADSI